MFFLVSYTKYNTILEENVSLFLLFRHSFHLNQTDDFKSIPKRNTNSTMKESCKNNLEHVKQ